VEGSAYLAPIVIQVFVATHKINNDLVAVGNPFRQIASVVFVEHGTAELRTDEDRKGAHLSNPGDVFMQRRKDLCVGQPPMIRGNHQVPGIANERKLKAFIPSRPEDFPHFPRLGVLMIFGFPNRPRTLCMQNAQDTMNTASGALRNVDKDIF
jgi:hypothetical protein